MTTTRRGWRAALDSSLLLAVVVCGSASALLAAAPAAAVVTGRAPAVASVGPAAALVAAGTQRAVVDKGLRRSCVFAVAALAMAPAPSTGWSSGTSENAPRDSVEDDDDDDEALEHALTPVAARGVENRELTHLDLDPAVSLESDGHSLRAPPR